MEKVIVYVTQMSHGAYEGREEPIIYAGTDYELAKKCALEYKFPDSWNNFGYVNHWKDGKEIKNELVRE